MSQLPTGEGVAGVFRVHGVRRVSAESGPSRAAEGLEQLQHNLVGAIRTPQLAHIQTGAGFTGKIIAERLTQLNMFTIRITVQRRRNLTYTLGNGIAYSRIRCIWILIDVKTYRDIKLRSTIRFLTNQIIAQRQV